MKNVHHCFIIYEYVNGRNKPLNHGIGKAVRPHAGVVLKIASTVPVINNYYAHLIIYQIAQNELLMG